MFQMNYHMKYNKSYFYQIYSNYYYQLLIYETYYNCSSKIIFSKSKSNKKTPSFLEVGAKILSLHKYIQKLKSCKKLAQQKNLW